VREGEIDRKLLDIFLTNVRAPDQNWGDLKAQIAACNTGERKVHEMIERFGVEISARAWRPARLRRGAGARDHRDCPTGGTTSPTTSTRMRSTASPAG
jgi:N-methylhydantoinase B/oxoprolinase/acetone carboxylase alpha subunit